LYSGSGDGKKSSGLPVKMITAEECATEAINAVESRKPLVVIPKWYLPVVYGRKLFPSFVDNYLIKIFAPTPKKKQEGK
jgi:short-subunit dehydrogenase